LSTISAFADAGGVMKTLMNYSTSQSNYPKLQQHQI